MDAKFVARVVPSLALDFQSSLVACVGLDAASGVVQRGVT
jgi:hypothetical protein